VLGLTLLMAQIETITEVAQGAPPPPWVTWTQSSDQNDPPFTFDFSIEFDTSSDFQRNTVMSGKATFDANPDPAILVGSSVALDYSVAPVQDSNTAIFGTVSQVMQFTALNAVDVSGDSSTEDRLSGCAAAYQIAPGSPLAVSFPNNIINGQAPAIELGGLRLSGRMNGTISAGGLTFKGEVTLSDTTQDADYHGDVNGTAADYTIRLFPSDSELRILGNCVEDQQAVFLAMTGIVEELTDLFIESNRMLDRMPSGGGVIFTSSGSQGLINYTIDLEEYTSGEQTGTMSGQLSIYSNISVPGGQQTTLQISYNVDAELTAGAIRYDGRNGSEIPFRAEIDFDDDYEYWGTGTIDLTNSCDTTFDVPETDPLEPDGEDFRDDLHETGENTIGVDSTTDSLGALLVYTEDGTYAINIDINGVPVPPEALDQPIQGGDD